MAQGNDGSNEKILSIHFLYFFFYLLNNSSPVTILTHIYQY